MSSRPQFNPAPVIGSTSGISGDMSANITSKITITQKLSQISYGISWVGSSPVGTMSVQVSNDYSQNADGSVNNPGTWNTLTLSSVPAVSGNTGNGFIDIDANAGYALRLLYNFTSGSGTMTAIVNGKVA